MYSFKNDYLDGGHPQILKNLLDTYNSQEDGYGEDIYSQKAKELLKSVIGYHNIDIHFISGGTLTNLLAISSFLKPHEAVISAFSGHIYVHETGAIEATGHKVIPIESKNGKLDPKSILRVLEDHHFEHMVKPKLIYISQSTEIGTIYSKKEIKELRAVCDSKNLLLYIDGARLGSALTSSLNDLTLCDIATYSDAFYIGGTKNGAMLGEALVICNSSLKEDFRYYIKQRGAMLAKGRVLGLQFLTLFEEGLFYELSRHGNEMAKKLQDGIVEHGYFLQFESYTNQIFPILPEKVLLILEEKYQFYRWETLDDDLTVIRLVCSWNTEEKYVDSFLKDLRAII
ncbi:aminotransferase class I/II-fold pyridoxal phosphate-dependent enzyme [Thiospirochaeta perfilievii]|uniref:Aminotransferase class I/II-fold pyridoxal phosphate-dependent enzyme n=1 Tax=Thiospirochaeta perfilievii TaxID=252967 RepID=A0A5C1QBP2_9SPIO|nr:aminotransferase class I/II-fold pyridoxal phosphate-dependent enzyme [Thiospirochaeta perfilievii]QEN04289.1 aminotransferase class I/II-fold pyridoxal phosphate-dependent enzyme [Thiospirochaeta perfilievii]